MTSTNFLAVTKEVDDVVLKADDSVIISVMRYTRNITDWSVLSLLLGLTSVDLHDINTDPINNTANAKHKAIVTKWLQGGSASWAALVNGLRDEFVHRIDIANKIVIDHPYQGTRTNPEVLSTQNTTDVSTTSPKDSLRTNNGEKIVAEASRLINPSLNTFETSTDNQQHPQPPLTHLSILPSAIDKVYKRITEVTGRMKISRVFIHGAPRVGKTCVKRLVLNQPAVIQNSTGLVEDPARAIATTYIVNVDKTSLDQVDEEIAFEMIKNQIQKAVKIDETMPSTGIKHIPNSSESDKPTTDKPTHHTTTNNSPSNHTTSCNTTAKLKQPKLKLLSKIASDLDFVKPNFLSFFDCHHVHLVDSGGQPQFSDLLPLIQQSQTHHHMVVIRLDQLLHDKTENCLQIDGKKYILSEFLSLTNYQLIERVCQLASGSNSRVFVVGTHLDCENKTEPLSKKNELLKPLLTKYPNLTVNENNEPIFAVKAMTKDGNERKKFAATLQKAILSAPILVEENDNTDEDHNTGEGILVPLKWIILEIELSHRSKQTGVLHIEEICEVADALEITGLLNALEFFKKLAIHYHYTEVLPNIVFTSVSPISSLLSNIVKASFKHPPVNVDQERLQNNGELTVKFLNQLSHKLQAIEHFPMEEFIRLMCYLRVLFDIDSDTYLIPSLLPVETTIAIDDSYHQEPLLCYWLSELDEVCILPQSFFNALIVELLRRDEVKLNRKCKQSRSAFVFDVTLGSATKECRVCVVDKAVWLEIFVEKLAEYNDCRLILNMIQTCTKHVLELLHVSSLSDLQYGLWCSSLDCCIDFSHPSKCTDGKRHNFNCLETGNEWEVTTVEQLFWCQVLSITTRQDGVGHQRKPQLNDMFGLLREKSSKWYEIGVAFGVSLSKRESTRRNTALADNDCLKYMLYTWLETSEQSIVTWDEFIRILKDVLEYCDIVNKTEVFLQ